MAPRGYLIHTHLLLHPKRSTGAQSSVLTTTKYPVEDYADATVFVVQALSNSSPERKREVMAQWVSCLMDHKTPTAKVSFPLRGQDVTDEFWFEPFTSQDLEEYEKASGLEKKEAIEENRDGRYTKVLKKQRAQQWPSCEECDQYHNPEDECPEDDYYEVEG